MTQITFQEPLPIPSPLSPSILYNSKILCDIYICVWLPDSVQYLALTEVTYPSSSLPSPVSCLQAFCIPSDLSLCESSPSAMAAPLLLPR